MRIPQLCLAVLAFVLSSLTVHAAEIHQAAAKGDLARVQALIGQDAALVNFADPTGAAPLHWAAAGRRAAVAEFLLSNGADVGAAKANGVTPLHIAAGEGFSDLVVLFLAKGADVNAKDKYGRTPISLARGRGRADIVRLLTARGAADPPSSTTPEAAPDSDSITGRAIAHSRSVVRGCPVNAVYVNLHDPGVRLSAAISRSGIGGGESFGSFVQRLRPTVAVNGTFFSKSNLRPIGDIVIGGRLVYFGGMGTGICIADNNKVSFVPVQRGRHTDWSAYDTVVCAGPRLLESGQVCLDARGEGFRDPHVLGIARRAAVGLTYMNRLVMVNTEKSCSLDRLAGIMKDLGCTDAVNLDGGSSVAMHYRGRTIASPGRNLTNVLLVYEQSDSKRASR